MAARGREAFLVGCVLGCKSVVSRPWLHRCPPPHLIQLHAFVAKVAAKQEVVARLDHPGEAHEQHAVHTHGCRNSADWWLVGSRHCCRGSERSDKCASIRESQSRDPVCCMAVKGAGLTCRHVPRNHLRRLLRVCQALHEPKIIHHVSCTTSGLPACCRVVQQAGWLCSPLLQSPSLPLAPRSGWFWDRWGSAPRPPAALPHWFPALPRSLVPGCVATRFSCWAEISCRVGSCGPIRGCDTTVRTGCGLDQGNAMLISFCRCDRARQNPVLQARLFRLLPSARSTELPL